MTMQEVIQYEASYGSEFLVIIIVAAGIYIFTNLSFASTGNRTSIERGSDIYKVYCGKYIVRFYDFFAVFLLYDICRHVWGVNSTAMEQW